MIVWRVIAALIVALCCSYPRRNATADRTIIPWAWERRESLTRLPVTEVAYLAGTISSRGALLVLQPRMQPLYVPRNAQLDPVFRIETRRTSFEAGEAETIAEEIVRTTKRTHPGLVQIDFDATVRQRPFYRSLLIELRRMLPRTTKISITALASWCMDDRWLHDLPIDEAVPMLFRMGPDDRFIRRRLNTREPSHRFVEPRCAGSVGLGTDEPFTPIRTAHRVYIFHPRPWTRGALRAAEQEIDKW